MNKNISDISLTPFTTLKADDLFYVARQSPVPEDGTFSGEEMLGLRPKRKVAQYSTESLNDGQSEAALAPVAVAFSLVSITMNAGAWVRVYQSVAARNADASRPFGMDPEPDAGVVAEVALGSGGTVSLNPVLWCSRSDSLVSNELPIRVTNRSGSSRIITVSFDVVEVS